MIGWLRFGHTKRRPRARYDARRGQIPDMVSIHDRPPEIEERLIQCHWEGDFIKGARPLQHGEHFTHRINTFALCWMAHGPAVIFSHLTLA